MLSFFNNLWLWKLLKDLCKLFVTDTLITDHTTDIFFPSRSELQVMEHLVSSWCNDRSLPESYILPPEKRPEKLTVPLANNIPVIDLGGHDQTDLIQQILEACQEFGFFQVINHGVPSNLMDEAMSVFKEFHALSAKDKAIETSKDPNKSCYIYTSSQNYATEKFHF
ncbi:hypothetical protein SO802_023080 [Lithocarpus litseifolius]|uniref:Non-haem dioxygenase N-terminal domain-containing protein n=1 Tax=Lithocarpus litseifolius TaxID=425828 RepID=A0AAW2C7N7_9ROSI